jgi:outer membrane protein
MKKIILMCFLILCQSARAANLIEVAQQAIFNDAIYHQAVAQRLATNEGVPIAASVLLPNISAMANPSVTQTNYSGANLDNLFLPRNNIEHAYTIALTITQTIFNFAQLSQLAGAWATSRGADAKLNAALQDLMIRVAKAYFTILQDEDNLSYSEATKLAFAEQLDQVKQQYQVGVKTLTEVYTAQAAYESAYARVISDQSTLLNDKEKLRVITGHYYSKLAGLRDDFPLITPRPADIEQWVKTALMQNWGIKAAQYATETARQVIRRQFSGHLPTLNVQGVLDRQYQNNMNGYFNTIDFRPGPSTQTDRSVTLNLNVPIFAGGGVVAQTNQAIYNYQAVQQQLEQTVRTTMSNTRISYMNVVTGVPQIIADRQAIKSNKSSLAGMEESYRVGTETLVDVLNQQQKLFQAQTEYAKDRYAFVNNILLLKQAAGTLSFDDLRGINVWLAEKPRAHAQRKVIRHRRHRHTQPHP